jgi:hypothetical protein
MCSKMAFEKTRVPESGARIGENTEMVGVQLRSCSDAAAVVIQIKCKE